MRTIGIVAAAIIALLYFSTPQEQQLAAKPQVQVEQVVGVDQLQELTQAIGSLEQRVGDRLDAVETQFTSFESPQSAGCPDCPCPELEDRVSALEADVAALKSPTKVETKVTPTVSSEYSPRWQNYDGRTARDHAVEVHGFDATQSDSDLAILHDAWHDANGSHPPKRQVTRSWSVASPSSCPGGVCPTYSRTTTRTVNRSSAPVFGQPLRNLGKVLRR